MRGSRQRHPISEDALRVRERAGITGEHGTFVFPIRGLTDSQHLEIFRQHPVNSAYNPERPAVRGFFIADRVAAEFLGQDAPTDSEVLSLAVSDKMEEIINNVRSGREA